MKDLNFSGKNSRTFCRKVLSLAKCFRGIANHPNGFQGRIPRKFELHSSLTGSKQPLWQLAIAKRIYFNILEFQ